MKLPRPYRFNYLFATIAALLGLGALFGISQLREIQTRLESSTIAQGVWAVSQGEGRLLDFMNVAQVYIRDPGAENAVLLRERLDILWSRYDTLTNGRIARIAGAYHDYPQTMKDFKESLEKVDVLAQDLTPENALVMFELLQPLQEPLHQILISTSQRATTDQAIKIAYIEELTFFVAGSLTILMLTGGAAIFFFYRENQRATSEMQARMETEVALRTSKEEAEAANAAKSIFLAKMTHELRTPLNAIIGFSSLIQSQAIGPINNEKYLEYAEDINSSGTYLLELISDVLDISVIESGQLPIEERAFATDILVRSCEVAFRPAAVRKKIDFRIETTDAPPFLFGDVRRIRQILFNLLSNAFKFTPEGGSVVVSFQRDDSGVTFSVTDTGAGIPEASLERIFVPFVQVAETMHQNIEGFGLGLSIVKHLTEMHDGRVEIASAYGAGTKASIWLPAKRVVDADPNKLDHPEAC